MGRRFNSFVIISLLYLFLDVYSFLALKSLFESKNSRMLFTIVYVAFSCLVYYSLYQFYIIASNRSLFSSTQVNFHLGLILTAVVTKLFFVFFMLLQDGGRLLFGLVGSIQRLFSGDNLPESTSFFPARRKFLTLSATGLASIPFGLMLYGVSKGKYRYTVNETTLTFEDLPPAFDGFKIAQISDIHAGSLDSKSAVARGIQMINDLKTDLIVFTGDLVNSDKDEINPYIDIFEQLKAPFGKYAILGNHDYYGVPDKPENTPEEQTAYWKDFYTKYDKMGFQLLLNENVAVEKGNQSIKLLGVENWGASRYFPKKGDLDQTLQGCKDDDFCVLLSHDPTHWDEKVIEHQKHIHLTLSGHTHGMQFGINIPGFKWSPAQYRYPRWNGLYQEAKQYLYVNRGFGFLAFPGRIGMWPEITVIELKKA